MLLRYRSMGRAKPYLVFALTDETYALVCEGAPEKTDEKIILSFAGTAWALISLYMSGGIMYAAVEFCLTGALLSAMVFIGKKVEGL